MTPDDRDPQRRVTLSLPDDPSYLRVARLAASAVGSLAGFDIERIGDLCLAVHEAIAALMAKGQGPVHLTYLVSGSTVRVEGHADEGLGPIAEFDDEVRTGLHLVTTLADDFVQVHAGGTCGFVLELHRNVPAPELLRGGEPTEW